ncbi:MAG: Uma2 family endonuclease [Prevotellaceae bacterium]|jgi:Uma2 family endonuclease|nr:Uma2 family endonuclease [Prevotellaceae bacterium]
MDNAFSLDLNSRYTYADYLTWVDDKRCELVDGFIKMMSAPITNHQRINFKLGVAFDKIIQKNKGKCEVFIPPFDVRLPKNGETADNKIYTVVQPDLCIVCDPSKIDYRGCLGAPDFVAEIQSPSTAHYDLNEKLHLYEAAGVREYWVALPEVGVNIFILQPDRKYNSDAIIYYKDQKAPIHIFDGVEIDLKEVFE